MYIRVVRNVIGQFGLFRGGQYGAGGRVGGGG